MEKYKYIVVDDEYPTHITVLKHLKAYPNYSCVDTFFNPEHALQFLQKHDIDLIFLDIEMPQMNGFKFMEALNKKIFIVILTAYQEKYGYYAHQFYDRDLIFFSSKAQFFYYLPRIIACFEKKYADKEIIQRVNQLSVNEIHTFPKIHNNKAIPLRDILHIMIIGHNIVLKLKNGEEIIYRMTLRELIKLLPSNNFMQIKRNLVINIMHVTAFTETTVCIHDQHFSISARRRSAIIHKLKTQREWLCETY